MVTAPPVDDAGRPFPSKALSLSRPWAALVLLAGKDIENRCWSTSHRGITWIHGALSVDSDAEAVATRIIGSAAVAGLRKHPLWTATGLLGTVDIYDVVDSADSPWAFPGQWHWRIRHAAVLPSPVPCRGWQRLWTPPGAATAAAVQQLAAVA